jgi:hypothetical protein
VNVQPSEVFFNFEIIAHAWMGRRNRTDLEWKDNSRASGNSRALAAMKQLKRESAGISKRIKEGHDA